LQIKTIQGEFSLARGAYEQVAGNTIIRMVRAIPKYLLWPDTFLVRRRSTDNFYARTGTLVNTIAMTMEAASSIEEEIRFNQRFVADNWDLCFILADWKGMDADQREDFHTRSAELAATMGEVRDGDRRMMKLWTALAATIPQVGAARTLHSSSAEHGEKRGEAILRMAPRIDARRVPLMKRFRAHKHMTQELVHNLERAVQRLEKSGGRELDVQLEQTVLRNAGLLIHEPWGSKSRKFVVQIKKGIKFWSSGDKEEALEWFRWARATLSELETFADLAELYFWFVPEYYRRPRNHLFVEALRVELEEIAVRVVSDSHHLRGTRLGQQLEEQLMLTCNAWDRGWAGAYKSMEDAKEQYRRLLFRIS